MSQHATLYDIFEFCYSVYECSTLQSFQHA